MTPKHVINEEIRVFHIDDFQWKAGPLTELDPHAVLREINEDVSRTIGKALQFANEGDIGKLEQPLLNSFTLVGMELNSRGQDLDLGTAKVYARALQSIAIEYLDNLSTTGLWVTHHPNFLGARYSNINPSNVEVALRYDIRRPQLEQYDITPQAVAEITPTLLYVTKQLLGAAVEADDANRL